MGRKKMTPLEKNSRVSRGMTVETLDEHISGDWVRPIPKGFLHTCCDCGEVGAMEFRIVSVRGRPTVEFRMWRHNAKTDEFRKSREMRQQIVHTATTLLDDLIREQIDRERAQRTTHTPFKGLYLQ